MEKPVEVQGPGGMTPEQMEAALKARHDRRIQTTALIIFGIIILTFFVPLGVWLTRGAMGLW
jgi:hypothetical protein